MTNFVKQTSDSKTSSLSDPMGAQFEIVELDPQDAGTAGEGMSDSDVDQLLDAPIDQIPEITGTIRTRTQNGS